MQSIARTAMTGLVCALLMVASAGAVVTSWTADQSGNWNEDGNWDNGAPGSGDDAKHKTKLNDIKVRNGRDLPVVRG